MPETETALDLDAIRARLATATAGEWRLDTSRADTLRGHGIPPGLDVAVRGGTDQEAVIVIGNCNEADAEFIASAKADIRALFKENGTLERAVALQMEEIDRMSGTTALDEECEHTAALSERIVVLLREVERLQGENKELDKMLTSRRRILLEPGFAPGDSEDER